MMRSHSLRHLTATTTTISSPSRLLKFRSRSGSSCASLSFAQNQQENQQQQQKQQTQDNIYCDSGNDNKKSDSNRASSYFPKRGQELELVCESLAYKGKGVCKVADTGFVVLCDRVLPGEKFIGRVTRKKGSYAEVSRFTAFIARAFLFFVVWILIIVLGFVLAVVKFVLHWGLFDELKWFWAQFVHIVGIAVISLVGLFDYWKVSEICCQNIFWCWLILLKLQATKLKTLSPHWDSVDAPCEYASYCGGCKTQNLSYEAQLRAKEGQVRDLVVHVGKFSDKYPEFAGIMKPIVPCDIQFHYRNKVSVQNKTFVRFGWVR